MTKEEYKKQLEELNKELERKRNHLQKEYARLNNPYKIGDIFEDRIGKIKIDRIQTINYVSEFPCCIYSGFELKKDGTPKKNNSYRDGYQSNDIKNKRK